VSEGTRTPDRLDHNQELYQLSYAHRGGLNLAAGLTFVTQRFASCFPLLCCQTTASM